MSTFYFCRVYGQFHENWMRRVPHIKTSYVSNKVPGPSIFLENVVYLINRRRYESILSAKSLVLSSLSTDFHG